MNRLRRARIPVLVFVLTLSGSVVIAAAISRWIPDQARYDAFRSSSACTQGPAPADGDCVARQSERVLDVQSDKGEMSVWAQGWPGLNFDDPGFVSGLRTGDTVQVVVWRGTAQGLETESAGPEYADDSAVLAPTGDWTAAAWGASLLLLGGVFVAEILLRRPGASRERVRTVQWSSAAAAGLAFLNGLGVMLSVSITGGFIADGVLGALVLVVLSLIWGLGSRPGRVWVPAAPADVATGLSANARKRRRPRSRPRPRRRGPRR